MYIQSARIDTGQVYITVKSSFFPVDFQPFDLGEEIKQLFP